jgi:Domain of unknown function (DUF4160)
MPTILLLEGYRFFFYSNENNEPPHIHVRKGNGEGKIWLEPTLEIAWLHDFTSREENKIWQIASEHLELFKTKWYEYFSK